MSEEPSSKRQKINTGNYLEIGKIINCEQCDERIDMNTRCRKRWKFKCCHCKSVNIFYLCMDCAPDDRHCEFCNHLIDCAGAIVNIYKTQFMIQTSKKCRKLNMMYCTMVNLYKHKQQTHRTFEKYEKELDIYYVLWLDSIRDIIIKNNNLPSLINITIMNYLDIYEKDIYCLLS